MESVFETGRLEGFLAGQDGKKPRETEEIQATEAGSHEGHKTNDSQQ